MNVMRRWECRTCHGANYHREGCPEDNYPHDPRVERDQAEWVEYVPAEQLRGAIAVLCQVLAAYDEHGPSNPPMPILDALIEAEDFIRDHGGGR